MNKLTETLYLTPVPVTEEEFEYLENCLMSVPTYKTTEPTDKIKLELLERTLDSREGNYLHPISDIEKRIVVELLQKRNQ